MSKLSALVRGVMTLEPAAPAIDFHGKWYSWGDLTAVMDGLSRVFAAEGVAPGTRVGGLLRNTPEIAALILELITGDRCVVTLNPLMPEDKLITEIEALQLPVLVALSEDWKREGIAAAAKKAGLLGIEIVPGAADPVRVVIPRGEGSFRSDAEGIAIEMLTSGTTGTPKRIPLKAKNFDQMILDAAHFENRSPDDPPKLRSGVSILNTPFSHIGGIFGLFVCLSAGRKACMLDRFQVETFVDALVRHRPPTVSAPPSALRMLLDANVPAEKLSSLKVFRTSTAPLDPDLADEFQDKYGVPILQNYGATEFAGGVAGWTIGDHRRFPNGEKRGSVGKMNPGVDGRIVDQQSGEPVPYGTPGLLELRAPHLGDGKSWVRTTDIARMDEDQFLWIMGRADNAIIRGGFKVIPDDVVRAMESHPAVIEACVLAMPDPRLGQVPVAAYRERSGQQVGEDELRAYLREKLTAYQVPVRVMRLQEFPRTPSMKISQPELRKLFEPAAA
ncbi:MAG: long-chain fatty acid--CoA ligase [Sphingomonadaceae bacterium]|nr:long-chain fatty acid--CoA ligase [Sphingomonadaceae bacterium]